MFSDVFQSIRKTGLYFAGFHHPPYKNKFTSFFRNILNDSDLQQTIEKLGYEDQAAVVELVYGDMDLYQNSKIQLQHYKIRILSLSYMEIQNI